MKNYAFSLLAFSLLFSLVKAAPDFSARAAICGRKGYDGKTEGYYYGSEGTYDACAAACRQDSTNCKSFSFGDGECNLYTVHVAGNFVKDNDSPYVFYDASCIVSSSSKPSIMATMTTTKAVLTTTTITSISSTDKGTATQIACPAIIATTTSAKASTTTTTTQSTLTTSKPSTTRTTSVATTAETTTSLATSSSLTPPCPLPTWTVSDFVFFNSSHNLDCVNGGVDYDNPLCFTGRDPQPAGWGPPDSVSAVVSPGIGSCHQQNPGTTPRREVGSDVVRCGGSAYQFAFFGDSNNALSTARFNVQNQINCPGGSSYLAMGTVEFQMSCSYDSGMNATCQAVGGAVTVPATSFS